MLRLLAESEQLAALLAAGASRAQSAPYRALQVIYAALLSEGHALRLHGEAPEDEVAACESLYESATDIVALSMFIILGRRGQRTLRVEGGRVLAAPTEVDDALFELLQNVAEAADVHDDNPVLDSFVAEAERVVLGRRIADLFDLAAREWVVRLPGGVLALDLNRAHPSDRHLADAATLTLSRMENFEAPYFFDMGIDDPTRDPTVTVARASESMWLAYYPLLQAYALGESTPGMAVTTRSLLAHVITTAEVSNAYRMVRLSRTAKDAGDEQGTWITDALARRLHQKFEETVAQAFKSLGLTALSSIVELGGRPLDCGEIDVLAAAPGVDGRYVLIVCEAKDVDVPLMKDLGYEHLDSTMDRAAGQVARKASWAARSIAMLRSPLRIPTTADVTVVGMIATRRPVPFPMLRGWPGGELKNAKAVVTAATTLPRHEWRADLIQGIVMED